MTLRIFTQWIAEGSISSVLMFVLVWKAFGLAARWGRAGKWVLIAGIAMSMVLTALLRYMAWMHFGGAVAMPTEVWMLHVYLTIPAIAAWAVMLALEQLGPKKP